MKMSIGGDIYALPAEGGSPRDLTENRKSSPDWFQWSPSSKQILLGENVAGLSAISTLDLASGSYGNVVERRRDDAVFGRRHNQRGGSQFLEPASGSLGRRNRQVAADHALQRSRGVQPTSVGRGEKHRVEERRIRCAGLADSSAALRSGEALPDAGRHSWRPGFGGSRELGRGRDCRCNCFPAKAISSSCRIRAAVMGKAKTSRAPTCTISGMAIWKIFWPAWTRW